MTWFIALTNQTLRSKYVMTIWPSQPISLPPTALSMISFQFQWTEKKCRVRMQSSTIWDLLKQAIDAAAMQDVTKNKSPQECQPCPILHQKWYLHTECESLNSNRYAKSNLHTKWYRQSLRSLVRILCKLSCRCRSHRVPVRQAHSQSNPRPLVPRR